MSRISFRFVRQYHQFFFDGTDQPGHAAGGKIRSSHGTVEQRIAAEHDALIRDACKTKASASRANTVLGVRKDKEDPSKITGLVFYGVKDAADVCSKYAAFAK